MDELSFNSSMTLNFSRQRRAIILSSVDDTEQSGEQRRFGETNCTRVERFLDYQPKSSEEDSNVSEGHIASIFRVSRVMK
jgi:hypothetical protein